jgi:glycosyltransferase involved in cell wall biosynthesis
MIPLPSGKYILFLGRIVPEKRIDLLLTAFSSIQNKITCDLVIAGPVEDKNIIKDFEHNNRIHFLGPVFGREKQFLLANAYIYVLPSDLEGFSVSLLEAMASQCLCLVSDINANKEVLSNTGIYFSAGDVSSLNSKLFSICNNYSKYSHYKTAAHQRIKENFTWELLINKMISYYREC